MARDTGPIRSEASKDQAEIIEINGQSQVNLAKSTFMTDGDILRDGQDLVLRDGNGQDVIVEDYFSANPPPPLLLESGAVLSPELINSFVQSTGPVKYSQSLSESDVSPVGMVDEITGEAFVSHPDGTRALLTEGAPVYQNDIIETGNEAAVKITFLDNSSFAVSENARLAIDEYVYDPATDTGTSDFSLLRGLFIYTSGLIGREDPDDVEIDTPIGSIGIRGTIITGQIDPAGDSQITVVEGAIVIQNDITSVTLTEQLETLTITNGGQVYDLAGAITADSFFEHYGELANTNPDVFTRFAADYNAPESIEPQAGNETHDAADRSDASTEDGVQPPSTNFYDVSFTGNETIFTGDSAPSSSQTTLSYGTGPITSDVPLSVSHSQTSASEAIITAPDLLPLALDLVPQNVVETARAGDLIALVKTTVAFPDVSFTINDIPRDPNGDDIFSARQISSNQIEFRLTVTGEVYFKAGDVYGISLTATLPDGRTVTNSPQITVLAQNSTSLNLNTIAGADGFVIEGATTSGERLGETIAAMGDLNGDGLDDSLVANGTATGAQIFSLSGGTQTLSSESTVPGSPSTSPELASAEDFDGDGTPDYIVGAPASDSPATDGGSAVITSANQPMFSGQDIGDALGTSATAIGDINNDGLTDILVGAPLTDQGGNADAGAGYVVFGDPSLSLIDLADSTTVNGIPDFQDAGQGFAIEGLTAGDMLGATVADAGDFNNDGYADFMLSEPGQGRVHVGFSSENMTDLTLGSDTLQINGLAVDPANSTIPLMSMGDMNGDGISDIGLIANAYNSDGDAAYEEAAYVLYGQPSYSGGQTVDVNSMAAADGYKITVSDTNAVIESAGYAGDFNGDGLGDTAIAIRNESTADIYVVYGRDGTPGDLTEAMLTAPYVAFHMTYDLSSLTNPATDPFEFVLSTAGDADGDGFDDLAIGTPDANNGDGAVTLVYGRNVSEAGSDGNLAHIAGQTTTLSDVAATGNGQHLIGDAGDNSLQTNSFTDISLRGGAGNDLLQVDNGDPGAIDGGGGYDKLEIIGTGTSLDYSTVGPGFLANIETISMGADSQSIQLGLDDIFQLMQESTDNRLLINESGTPGDTTSLTIDDHGTATGTFATEATNLGFSATGTATEGSITYDVFTANGGPYQLLVDQNIDAVNVA